MLWIFWFIFLRIFSSRTAMFRMKLSKNQFLLPNFFLSCNSGIGLKDFFINSSLVLLIICYQCLGWTKFHQNRKDQAIFGGLNRLAFFLMRNNSVLRHLSVDLHIGFLVGPFLLENGEELFSFPSNPWENCNISFNDLVKAKSPNLSNHFQSYRYLQSSNKMKGNLSNFDF